MRGPFVTSCFEELGASGEGERAEGFHEVKEGQGRAHEEDRVVVLQLLNERREVEFGFAKKET